ncbi:hypothetical protein [uncultured Brachyspira sp.]|uniref:hypothetical protein n=1 Tax=uncultured Brachyspira sp. TaxID=221953 RepID=UPI00258ADD40|nr:hypothetical protein [uncultured Brachyspira sp.]
MAIITFLFKLFSSKTTYVVLLILTMIITIQVFRYRIKSYKNEIVTLENTIEDLEITNEYLYKENTLQQKAITLLTTYSNSTMIINKLNRNKLNKEQDHAINNISNDFYDYHDSLSNN